MTVIRRNILASSDARDKFIRGVKLLKQEFLGPTANQFGIGTASTPISTYDLFVIWHYAAMFTLTPPTHGSRNAAHGGSVFGPWHRFMLILLELHLQRVLDDTEFGLPYWDWAADGEMDVSQQQNSLLWTADDIGGNGNPLNDDFVATGPFRFDSADPTSWRVSVDMDVNLVLRTTDRGLRRSLQIGVTTLPRKIQVNSALSQTVYDSPDWEMGSTGFRDRLEGWSPQSTAPHLHNRVHMWVGGDMGSATSPNDPVFYLNHCNVDRIWEAWLMQNNRVYVPDQTVSADLLGHRIDDPMFSLISPPATPRQMLDVSNFYTYDTLAVA